MSDLREDSQEDDLHPPDIRGSCRGKRSRCQKKTREGVSSRSIPPPRNILMVFRFNKRREDFPDLRSYNDYLQEVEDISKRWASRGFSNRL